MMTTITQRTRRMLRCIHRCCVPFAQIMTRHCCVLEDRSDDAGHNAGSATGMGGERLGADKARVKAKDREEAWPRWRSMRRSLLWRALTHVENEKRMRGSFLLPRCACVSVTSLRMHVNLVELVRVNQTKVLL